MTIHRLRLGVAQMTSTDQVASNLTDVKSLLRQGQSEHCDIVVFPENTLYFRIQNGQPFPGIGLAGVEFQELQREVNRGECALMITTALPSGQEKLFNSTVVLTPHNQPESVYTKIHLFDVDVPGSPPVRESDHFLSGIQAQIWEFKGWKFGLSICYDVRFAELYLKYAQRVDVILVPSAFLVPTGEAHWHTLLRARAIESQCFVAAPAQSGVHRSENKTRQTFGHSLVIDPWGRQLMELVKSPVLGVVDLDLALIAQVRQQIPMRAHRRL